MTFESRWRSSFAGGSWLRVAVSSVLPSLLRFVKARSGCCRIEVLRRSEIEVSELGAPVYVINGRSRRAHADWCSVSPSDV